MRSKGKQQKTTKQQKKTKQKSNKTNKEGLGTLKPSPQKKQKNPTKKKNPNTKISKNDFSVISQFLLFLVGVHNFPFLTTWPKKLAPQSTIKIGVSAKHFLKNRCAKRPFLDNKNKFRNSSYHFCFASFFSFNNKKPNILLKNIIFIVF